MKDPDRSWRISWCLVTALVVLTGCEKVREPPVNQVNSAAPQTPKQIVLPRPAQPLDRERILTAVAQARSSYAAGEDDRAVQGELDGKRFELRIRFGCEAPPTEAGTANPGVRHDPAARTIELSAAPNIGFDNPIVQAIAGDGVETAEGFWVSRPRLLRPACPSVAGSSIVPSVPETGLVQFFTTEDSRVSRRDERAYTTLVRLDPDENPARPQGYDLVLTGRLRAGPAGRVIRCASSDPGAIPVCLVGAEFERVRIDDVARGTAVAEWGRG